MPDAPFCFDRSIALVGLMGAGKSSVGRRLATRLRLPFADTDEEVERAAGRGIAEIFDQNGEEDFREGERRAIARLVEGPPRVIATGGGAFMNERTRALILDRCIAVWLDADPALLAERVSRSNHRPLLKGKESLPVLRELAAVRNPVYANAHVAIRSDAVPHDDIVDRIVAALKLSPADPRSRRAARRDGTCGP